MSVNHQWVEFSEQVYTRYKKTSVNAIQGKRQDPLTKARIDFILASDWRNFNMETEKLTFNYDTDVIEVYSAEEDRVFRALNSYLFQNGFLAPYDGTREAVNTNNAISDVDVSDIAASKNLLQFKKRIRQIDSRVTLDRILDTVKRADRPYSFVTAIEERLKEL